MNSWGSVKINFGNILYYFAMFLAGVPTKTELAGKLFNTTELAPIIQLSPIVTSPNTIEPAYLTTLLPNLGRPPFLSPRVQFWWIKQLSL